MLARRARLVSYTDADLVRTLRYVQAHIGAAVIQRYVHNTHKRTCVLFSKTRHAAHPHRRLRVRQGGPTHRSRRRDAQVAGMVRTRNQGALRKASSFSEDAVAYVRGKFLLHLLRVPFPPPSLHILCV